MHAGIPESAFGKAAGLALEGSSALTVLGDEGPDLGIFARSGCTTHWIEAITTLGRCWGTLSRTVQPTACNFQKSVASGS